MSQKNSAQDQQKTESSLPTNDDAYRPPTDEDWRARTLCGDESCIGVIGADGRCNDCGKPYKGVLPQESVARADSESEPVAEPTAAAAADSPRRAETEIDVDWDRRQLCRDESCIGVIGADGRCNECGLPFKDR